MNYVCYDLQLDKIFEVFQVNGRWYGKAEWDEGSIDMKCTFKKGFSFETSELYFIIGDI